ncbi:MAG: hypothetical protein Q7K55_02385 [Candidatus Levybacteria bacterium]|nr:hypothetical protein [Candidatus Levybacteria bacterium]
MKKFKYKVLITTSGIGSRLGEYTKYTNKALIRVGRKPVISYIIESYPKNTPFVVTLGHFGSHVKDFLNLVYKDRTFKFVEVGRYQGEGSSLGNSMREAAAFLQCPFIFNASDTIVDGLIPEPNMNWIGGFAGDGSSNYRSFNVLNGRIEKILEKGIINPDYLHIGLIGIRDYKIFWEALSRLCLEKKYKEELSDVHVLNEMLSREIDFKIKEFKIWHDTGNVEPLLKARNQISDSFYNLDKPKETIYIFNNKSVVKFYFDSTFIKERLERAKILKGLTPKINDSTDNFFSYKYVKGDLYADVANPKNFAEFLEWSQKKLWKPLREVSDIKFKKVCFDFYFSKTNQRIKEFLNVRGIKDTENIINEEHVPPIQEIFRKIDFEWLCEASQSGFHGDYILDNIIKIKKGFKLLDWRNNFGGLLKAGDKYYDFAKLNHNLIINHSVVTRNLFMVKIQGNKIDCDILRKENLIQCQKVLFNFLQENNYDARKVKILTCLIWFSSAPLHHKPYDCFLFYFAKLNLWRVLNEK